MSGQCATCECTDNSCKRCKTEACSGRNCYSCCCEETHSERRREKLHQALTLQYISMSWMFVEVLGAIGAAIVASSFALLAFGADSVIEMISAYFVLRHLNLDSAGSREAGQKTALLTSLLLISIVPTIGLSSTYAFFFLNLRPEASVIGIAIALASLVIMPIIWWEKRRIGEETSCLPLSVDAMESATCFLMAAALLVGLLGEYLFKLGWIDYMATLVIITFVAFEAKDSFSEATRKPPVVLR